MMGSTSSNNISITAKRLADVQFPLTAANRARLCGSSQNTTTAPLFRLPPEIRTHIYNAILGNHHIHLRHRRCYCPSRCAVLSDEDYTYPCASVFSHAKLRPQYPAHSHDTVDYVLQSLPVGYHDGRVHMLSPAPTEGPEREPATLPKLWLVSRQMHQETELLVYELTMFSFENQMVQKKWIAARSTAQIQAVRRLCLAIEAPKRVTTVEIACKGFLGLREVVVRCDCGGRCAPRECQMLAGKAWGKWELKMYWERRRKFVRCIHGAKVVELSV